MKLTHEQILITAKFFKELSELRLPMAQLLRLRQALRFIVEKAQEFDEVRQRVLSTYDLTDEEQKSKAEAEFQEALQQEIEFDFTPIPIRYIPEDQVFTLGFLEATEWLWAFDTSTAQPVVK